MNRPIFSKILPVLKRRFIAKCDSAQDDESSDIMEQVESAFLHNVVATYHVNLKADSAVELGKALKTPMQFENLKHNLNQGSVSAYDGFRVIVQKQVNLNTVVSHL